MKSAVRHIESNRRCRVVKLSAEYVVDDHDQVWLVRAQRIDTANVPTRKRPRTVLETSLAPSSAAPTLSSPGFPTLQSGGQTPSFMTPMRRKSDLSKEAFLAASTSALPRFAPQVPSWADPLSMTRSRSTSSVNAVSSAQLMTKMKQGRIRKKKEGKTKGAKAFALGSSQSTFIVRVGVGVGVLGVELLKSRRKQQSSRRKSASWEWIRHAYTQRG